jgi:esterase/lipase superfamily enzyme
MGSFVLGRALELMGEQTASGTPAFANVIFLAPDVDADRFRQMAPLIKKMARRVTLYASSRDLAMEAAQFVHGRRRAGGVDGDLLVAPNVFDTVDATYAEPRKLGPEHDYFATSPTVLADLFHLIRGEPPEQRFRLDPRQAKGGRYWFIREGAQ